MVPGDPRRNSYGMSVTTISTSLQTGRGRPAEILATIGFAAAFPLRMVRYYASPLPLSRPMAAALVPYQSREWDEPTRAGDDNSLLPSDPAGSLRRAA